MKKNILTLIVIFTFNIPLLSQVSAHREIERPISGEGPTKVRIFAGVLNISDINAAKQVLDADVYIVAAWKDPRLANLGSKKIIRPISEIWNPNISIINEQNVKSMLPGDAVINPDGTVLFKMRLLGEFSQKLDFSDFPFDTQRFVIKLASRGYGPDEVEFTTDSTVQSVFSRELTIMEWNVLELNNIVKPYEITKNVRPIASLTIEIIAERKSNFYLFSFIIPLIFIILMSMSCFWLHRQSLSAKVSVVVTSMLTLIAWRFTITGSLPKLSYLTRMDILIFFSTALIFLTILEVVLGAFLASHKKEHLADRIDLHSRWVFPVVYLIVFLVSFVF